MTFNLHMLLRRGTRRSCAGPLSQRVPGTRHVMPSGKGAAHFVSFCDMGFSAFFCIFLHFSLFSAFLVLNLEKSGKRSAKGCKSRKSHAPLSFCILFQCVKIS